MNLSEAKKIILKAQQNQEKHIDLGRLGLKEIPSELFDTDTAESLNLGSRYYENGKWIKSKNKEINNIFKHIPYNIRLLQNLKALNLHAVYAVDVYFLKELRRLKHLDLSFNYDMRDYSFLTYTKRLESLHLSTHRTLRSADQLPGFKNLKLLDLSYNYFQKISGLTKYKELEVLFLSDCGVQNIEPLQEFEQLQKLRLSTNKPADFSVLEKLPKMTHLDLGNCNFSDKDTKYLRNMKHLKHLNLWRNKIKDLAFLENFPELTSLNISENYVTDTSVLAKLPKLKNPDIGRNPITDYTSAQFLRFLE